MTKPKPCPYCGGEFRIITDGAIPYTIVECCKFKYEEYVTKEEAIKHLNDRAMYEADLPVDTYYP